VRPVVRRLESRLDLPESAHEQRTLRNRSRRGDVITRSRRFADVYEKQGRSGSMVFVVGETRWTNQRGELVRLGRDTLILT
jgi:hypothetical protein